MASCTYIFKRGASAGQPCGKAAKPGHEFCNVHAKTVLQLDKLPVLVHDAIVACMAAHRHCFYFPRYSQLLVLSRTSRYWHDLIAPHWDVMYRTLHDANGYVRDLTRYTTQLTNQQRLSLFLDYGCQKCGHADGETCWPFPIRVCNGCLMGMTTSAHNLTNVYLIPYSVYAHIDSHVVTHSRRSFRVYITSVVESAIGCRLGDYEQRTIDSIREHVRTVLGESDADLRAICPGYRDINIGNAHTLDVVRRQLYRHRAINAVHAVLPHGSPDLSAYLTGLVGHAEMSGDYDAIVNLDVAKARKEMATGRLRRLARYHPDVTIPDVADDDDAATKYVQDAVARRELRDAARNALTSLCGLRAIAKPRMMFPRIDDAVPLDEYKRRLDEKALQYTTQATALADLRSLAARFNAMGVKVDVDDATVYKAADVAKVVADTEREMRRWLLDELDELVFADALVAARAFSPSLTAVQLAPNLCAELFTVTDLGLADMLTFAEGAKVSAMKATHSLRWSVTTSLRERAMSVAGKSACHFRKYYDPNDSELANLEKTVAELHAQVLAEFARKQPAGTCHFCEGTEGATREFTREGLDAHVNAVHKRVRKPLLGRRRR